MQDFFHNEHLLAEVSYYQCAWKNLEEQVEKRILVEQVNCAIRKLALEYQTVLILKLGTVLKKYEIAQVLDLKPGTVKTRIHRARKQLKLLFLEQIGA